MGPARPERVAISVARASPVANGAWDRSRPICCSCTRFQSTTPSTYALNNSPDSRSGISEAIETPTRPSGPAFVTPASANACCAAARPNRVRFSIGAPKSGNNAVNAWLSTGAA
ncbi:Uncharacterised protein [Mycobacteroides abscessus subsp. abscessus]|nr:Uncharacterised protein [Mycobacteroides abscessus subsp. abscessus]